MSEYIVDVTGMESGDYAIAREEIVRCRDCKHLEVFYPFNVYRMEQSEIPEYHCTSNQFSNPEFPIEVEPDGFCAWGERRINDN